MKSAVLRANVGYVRPGQRVGKYILGEQIARGGMAEVWAARVEGPEGFVKSLALKFILESFAGDADLERLFVNEARVAAHLQHANLVSVFDFDKWFDSECGQAGRYYIAMERVDGQDLRRVLQVGRHKGRRVPPSMALHIAGEVLKGLRYVHERRDDTGGRSLGLVHRDVSPHNVLIGMGGEVKLSDFGIAKAMSQSLGTQAGTVRGKLAYGSPEQLRGEQVDHRADQFALGITLWEMLADRRLFDGSDEMEIIGKVLQCEVPPLPSTAAVHPAVEAMVRRMLAPRAADRFSTTAQALGAVLSAPGYLADASGVVELMQALFAARTEPLPPTVPMKISEVMGAGALAETSELEGGPGKASRRGAGNLAGRLGEDRGGAGERDPEPRERDEAKVDTAVDRSGSGYVSAAGLSTTSPSSSASWIDRPQAPGRPRRLAWAAGALAVLGVGASLVVSPTARRAVESRSANTGRPRVPAMPSGPGSAVAPQPRARQFPPTVPAATPAAVRAATPAAVRAATPAAVRAATPVPPPVASLDLGPPALSDQAQGQGDRPSQHRGERRRPRPGANQNGLPVPRPAVAEQASVAAPSPSPSRVAPAEAQREEAAAPSRSHARGTPTEVERERAANAAPILE